MRLQMLRTANPAEAGGPWMVMDEDLPAPANYNPIFVGTATECGRYIDTADHNATGCLMDAGHDGKCVNDEGDDMDQAEAEWAEASSHPSYFSSPTFRLGKAQPAFKQH